jgi:XRE family aerobic/anaerobic benzoate catabolism transcriptional regulator
MHNMSATPPKPGRAARPGPDESRLLTSLAARVRELRDGRGWSRAELASRSGLSIRFLARVESGAGNISILRLEALARALGTSPAALLRADSFKPRILSLVGLRGAGKSTVGALLGRRLGLPFIEIDRLVAENAGLPVDQLFELHGEPFYRRLEREAVQRVVAAGDPAVIAAAGGVVNDLLTWDLLRERTISIWLEASPEEHWNRVVDQGDRRPMADNPAAMEELRALLDSREKAYAAARITVDTTGRSPDDVVERIVARLEELKTGPR